MRIIGKNALSGYVKLLLDAMFIGGIIIAILLPLLVKLYLQYDYPDYTPGLYWYFLLLLLSSGIFALLIVYELRRIFYTLNEMNPFVIENVKCLRKIAFHAAAIAVLYISKIVIANTLMTMIAILVFALASIFSLILSEVFHQAVLYKEENDLTV